MHPPRRAPRAPGLVLVAGFLLGLFQHLPRPLEVFIRHADDEPLALAPGSVAAGRERGEVMPDPRRGEELAIEELRLDPRNVQAYVDGESAELTPTEFRLLYALALEQGRVLTRDELLQRVWGRRASHRDRTVDVFVRKLREKVDQRAPRHTFLQTRYGVGYKLEPEPK